MFVLKEATREESGGKLVSFQRNEKLVKHKSVIRLRSKLNLKTIQFVLNAVLAAK